MAERTGLEPATPGVTGRYSNQLNYRSALEAGHSTAFPKFVKQIVTFAENEGFVVISLFVTSPDFPKIGSDRTINIGSQTIGNKVISLPE
jgi:hypothetical protein